MSFFGRFRAPNQINAKLSFEKFFKNFGGRNRNFSEKNLVFVLSEVSQKSISSFCQKIILSLSRKPGENKQHKSIEQILPDSGGKVFRVSVLFGK